MLDPRTGGIVGALRVPDDSEARWDEARVQGDTIVVAAGRRLVALDRRSGAVRWSHAGAQERVAFALGGNRVFAVDYTAAQHDRGVGKPSWRGVFMDNPFKPVIVFNNAHGIVLAILVRHQFFAFDAAEGKPRWQHAVQTGLADLVTFEPPVVTRDFVICDDGAVLDVRTGQPAGLQQVGGRGTGCGRFVGSDALLTFRSALACVLDLKAQKRIYLGSTRSGCTNSMVPAAGLLNAPNFAHGCVCNYPFLASFALFHMPEAAAWAGPSAPNVQTSQKPGMD